jgi:hypothetical protein
MEPTVLLLRVCSTMLLVFTLVQQKKNEFWKYEQTAVITQNNTRRLVLVTQCVLYASKSNLLYVV